MSPPAPTLPPLPIDAVLPELRHALRHAGRAVLQAPPGAGKTTRLPLALMHEEWVGGRRIIMLEPRRLAARAAARHMASLVHEPVGERIGYRTRLDTRAGPRTVVEVVTEGVLTRMLRQDPALEQASLLIFDEFHERSLHADLGLALALLSREVLRPDLRMLVMSATLDAAPVAELIGGAPVITSQGRDWPVEIRWAGAPPPRAADAAIAATVRRALAEDEGDILVFLPGQAEIGRVRRQLADLPDVIPLYGDLSPAEQDRAIQPGMAGCRKIVLATSIAETSLTIEGVRVVVDSGRSRLPRFSPRTGLTRLETVRVSRAAAEQRAGRAGRVAPGICYRLWSEGEHSGLVPRHRPEILDSDLAALILELAAAGVTNVAELRWLDPPPAAAVAQSRELLRELGALDDEDRITAHGRTMAELPLHPRLAHLVLSAQRLGSGRLGATLAALLGERDVLAGDERDSDVRRRLQIVLQRNHAARSDVVQRVRETARRIERILPGEPPTPGEAPMRPQSVRHSRQQRHPVRHLDPADVDQAGLLLSFAYPDRIARLRGGAVGRYLLRNGRGAALDPGDSLAGEPWLVPVDVADSGVEGRIFLAAPITAEDVLEHHAAQISRSTEVAWDDARDEVRARRVERLGAIVIRESRITDPPAELVAASVLAEIRRRGIAALPWSRGATELRQRVQFLRHLEPAAWPDFSDAPLADTLNEWLLPHLGRGSSVAALEQLDFAALLRAQLDWRQLARLEAEAPDHVVVPSGSRIAVDYTDPAAPAIAVRLQEMFGATDTPRVGGGRVPLALRLLSPAGRPLQVTRDLAGFWKGSYGEVRKEMRGRYPKHEWPEDPAAATPTRRARQRKPG